MENRTAKLTDIAVGKKVKVVELISKGLSRQRMLDLGIVPNTIIHVLRQSPFGDPTAYLIRDTCIALREEEAKNIMVRHI
ncbi:ferrous iron transport protein A [Clostridium tagluense]|uniref:FeoA family protein n=1 Tax=Clostridium TaxID=1485 RepID=UPI0013E91C61|nr:MULTISPECIES: FeoA family protein [Clostridium]MBU3126831.1 ferrous iron transport protein A [Clostridium tagluense]MBW9155691.1 ferrous iron transport protein A [Clostridium tagluense]MBZ9625507.1 ferrous iron transport protein A [Clostridium sp. FP2]MCB2298234.1 ferrous iron transport protein A [Clostridium tagluense]MCB2310507.1 ferrous iron transport protein A [Clostridium tagluense]